MTNPLARSQRPLATIPLNSTDRKQRETPNTGGTDNSHAIFNQENAEIIHYLSQYPKAPQSPFEPSTLDKGSNARNPQEANEKALLDPCIPTTRTNNHTTISTQAHQSQHKKKILQDVLHSLILLVLNHIKKYAGSVWQHSQGILIQLVELLKRIP